MYEVAWAFFLRARTKLNDIMKPVKGETVLADRMKGIVRGVVNKGSATLKLIIGAMTGNNIGKAPTTEYSNYKIEWV